MCIFSQLNTYLKISTMKNVWFLFLLLVLASCSPDPVTPSGGDNGGSSGSNSGGNGGSDNPDADWLKANKIDESTLEIITSPRPDDVPTPRQATITLKSDLNYRVEATIQVKERESSLSAGEYEYGEPTTWD